MTAVPSLRFSVIVIYARYSSERQTEQSIEGQLRVCQEYVKRENIVVVGTYIDRAMTGTNDNRADFQRMIKDSAKQQFNTVIVWKLDRFARNRYDSAHYKSILKKNNVRVISATEAISQGAEGIILESVLEGMAEYYSAELAQKINRGMTENALKCKYNGGTLAVGYKINKETRLYEVDPLTAPIVTEAFNAYLDGKTMKQIADDFNAKGYCNTIGRKFSIDAISRMLQNRHYIGEYKFKDIVTPGGVPALIPIELFNAVQQRIIKTKKGTVKPQGD